MNFQCREINYFVVALTGSFRRAFFAGVAPSASHSATTLGLGHGRHSRICAAAAPSVTESVETKFLPDVDTFLAVAAQDVAGRTFALETSFRIDAISLVTQVLIHKTLVNIWKLFKSFRVLFQNNWREI